MWLKRSSLLAIFILLLLSLQTLDVKSKLSASFSAILPQGGSKETLLIYNALNQSQYVVLAAKRADLARILPQIEQLKGYESVRQNKMSEYRFYLADTPETLPNYEQIRERLAALKKELLDGFTFTIDKNDPLLLFENAHTLSAMPAIEGFEQTIAFKLNIAPSQYQEYYDKLSNIAEKNGAFVFSPFFYQVENAAIFSSQVKFILFLSTLILLFLYIYWLRQPVLLACVILTLLSAAAFSQVAAAFIWSEISLYSLIFAAAVSSVSIDYMFHYYVLGLYEKRAFSKTVFLGFLTTFGAFMALGFVSFTLISQIALTSAAALAFAYISFAFIYPHLGFGQINGNRFDFKTKRVLNPLLICMVSLAIIVLSPLWLRFDYDIKALDIENDSLDAKAKLVNSANQNVILLQANSLDGLIQKAKLLYQKETVLNAALLLGADEYHQKLSQIQKLDFASLKNDINNAASSLGFKKGYFDNSYNDSLLYPKSPVYEKEFLLANQIVHLDDKFYALGYTTQKITEEGVVEVNSARLFEKELLNARGELILAGGLTVVFIIGALIFAVRRDFLRALSFVVTPLAVCLCISVFTKITILHIFILVVIIAISVDYGIYAAVERRKKVKEAICYSLFSTIAGFGALAASSISSMRDIGIMTLCACLTIMILLYFMGTKDEINT
jgi:predicted exporter